MEVQLRKINVNHWIICGWHVATPPKTFNAIQTKDIEYLNILRLGIIPRNNGEDNCLLWHTTIVV